MKKTFLFLLLFTFSSSILALTRNEKTTLKSILLAEASITQCLTAGNDVCIANWLNASSSFIVWKTSVTATDVYADTGFDFTLVDGLTVGKRDEWSNFIMKFGNFNPSKSNIRAGIADVWSGTAAKVAVQTAILSLSKRESTNAEKVLATGTGTTISPGVLTFEGFIQVSEVSEILAAQ